MSDVIDKIRALAETFAKQEMHSEGYPEGDYFNACDASGGNYDDAYYYGLEDGEIGMARAILDLLPMKESNA